jgi:hypothetical protein
MLSLDKGDIKIKPIGLVLLLKNIEDAVKNIDFKKNY